LKRAAILTVLLLAATATAAALAPPQWERLGFGMRADNSGLHMSLPSIEPTADEWRKLQAGEPITRLLDAPDGSKIATMRFFAPFDPVTAWMVVTDVEHYDLVDSLFSASGSTLTKRHTLWPNAFENNVCVEQGRRRVSQLIVIPLVAPRKLCLSASYDASAFPWEWHMDLAGVERCCASRSRPDVQDYFNKAVTPKRNRESWFIAPLPPSLRKTPADALRTDCVYVADVNPGGELSQFEWLAKMAAAESLPQLARHIVAQGKRWERFLTDHYDSAVVAAYRQHVAEYRNNISAN